MSEQPRESLYTKMSRIMGELAPMQKGGTNKHFGYKFVTADLVADTIRVLLAREGIAFFANVVGRELIPIETHKTQMGRDGVITSKTDEIVSRWLVDYKFIFVDGASGEREECTWSAEAPSSDDKGLNKAATAAEKYFLLKTFMVATADEIDPDSQAGTPSKQVAKSTPQRPQQQRPTPTPVAETRPLRPGDRPSPNVRAITEGDLMPFDQTAVTAPIDKDYLHGEALKEDARREVAAQPVTDGKTLPVETVTEPDPLTEANDELIDAYNEHIDSENRRFVGDEEVNKANAAFDAVRTGEPEQSALGLVDKPVEAPKHKWDVADVKTHAIALKGYVKVSAHFDNLIADLYKRECINDNTTTEGVIAEIDLHYADGHHLKDKKKKAS